VFFYSILSKQTLLSSFKCLCYLPQMASRCGHKAGTELFPKFVKHHIVGIPVEFFKTQATGIVIIDPVDCMFENLQVSLAYLGSISILCLNGLILKVFVGCLFIFISLKNPNVVFLCRPRSF